MATTFVSGRFFDYRAVGLTPGAALYTYAAGTLTPQATYTDQGGGSSNANPVICDVNGGADVWLGTSSYKFRLYTDTTGNGGTLIDEWDNISSPALAADLANETDATLGSGLVGFAPEGTGAVGRTVFSILRERKRLTDRLSTTEIDDILSGAASIDISAKFNTALADAAGKLLILPWGAMNVNAKLSITGNNVWLEGQGAGTRILSSNATADIFELGDGASEISGLYFTYFDVWASVTKSAGHAFNCRFVSDSRWEAIRVGSGDDYVAAGNAHKLWNGYYFDRFSQNVIYGGELVVGNDAVKMRGNADQSFGAEISLDGGLRIQRAAGKGVWLGGASGGVYLRRVDISLCRYGVYCDDTLQTGVFNRELFIDSQATIDSCPGWGLIVKSNGLDTLDAQSIWVSGCGIDGSEGGVRVDATTGASVSAFWGSPRIQSNLYDGMSIASGIHSICGGYVRSNGTGAGGGHGIDAIGFSGLTVNGVTVHSNGTAARGRALAIAAAQTRFNVQGNTFFDTKQTGGIPVSNASGLSVDAVIQHNTGLMSENVSEATLLSGQTTLVVNHGLYAAPSAVLLQESGTMDAAQYAVAKTSDYTATQFTITLSGVAAANRTFVWRAAVGRQ